VSKTLAFRGVIYLNPALNNVIWKMLTLRIVILVKPNLKATGLNLLEM
jgi:hypothetical protein